MFRQGVQSSATQNRSALLLSTAEEAMCPFSSSQLGRSCDNKHGAAQPTEIKQHPAIKLEQATLWQHSFVSREYAGDWTKKSTFHLMEDWVVRGVNAVSSVDVSYSSQSKAYEYSAQSSALTWMFRCAMTQQIPSVYRATEEDTAGKTIFKRLVLRLLHEIHTEALAADAQPCLLINRLTCHQESFVALPKQFCLMCGGVASEHGFWVYVVGVIGVPRDMVGWN